MLSGESTGQTSGTVLLSCDLDGLAGHGQKLRCARNIAATTLWSLTWKFCVGSATAALTMALPPKPVLKWLNMTSTPRSRFFSHVVTNGTRAKIVVSRPNLWIKTNYSINKHGLGNKTTAISLLNFFEACARRGQVGPFQ